MHILEIFTSAYYTVQAFQTFLNSSHSKSIGSKHEFLAILYNYVSTFYTRTLYSARVSIIANVCNPASSCYTWTKSVGEFYEELIGSTAYKQMACEICNTDTYKHYNRIHLTREQIIDEHFSTIIYDSLQNSCEKCGGKLHFKKLDINNILCVDIENSKNCTVDNNNTVQLDKLITTITIDEKTLILIGVIAFQEAIREVDTRHYIAYCRSIEDSWYEYNNSSIRNRAPKVKDNFQLNLALLFYTEIDVPKVTA